MISLATVSTVPCRNAAICSRVHPGSAGHETPERHLSTDDFDSVGRRRNASTTSSPFCRWENNGGQSMVNGIGERSNRVSFILDVGKLIEIAPAETVSAFRRAHQ